MKPVDDLVSIVFSTDPLCSYCWAFEPAWRRLTYHYGRKIRVRHVYGGLLPRWEGHTDGKNKISSPADVEEHWAEVSRRFGQPIDASVWRSNPVSSSYPASIAMHAARAVGPHLEVDYLRRVRRAVFLEAQDIASADVLLDCARSVGLPLPGFLDQLETGAAERAFRADLEETKKDKLRPFPTLAITRSGCETIVLHGPQEFETLALQVLGSQSHVTAPSVPEALAAYRTATTRELMDVLELSRDQTVAALRRFGAREEAIAGDALWSTPTAP